MSLEVFCELIDSQNPNTIQLDQKGIRCRNKPCE
jgi:hypothetical protein